MSLSRLKSSAYGKLIYLLAGVVGTIAGMLLMQRYLASVVLAFIALLLIFVVRSRFWREISPIRAIARVIDGYNNAVESCTASYEQAVRAGRQCVIELHSKNAIDSELSRLLDNCFEAMSATSVGPDGKSTVDYVRSILDAHAALNARRADVEWIPEAPVPGIEEIVSDVNQSRRKFHDCQTGALDDALQGLLAVKPLSG